ncbi:aminopeptidase O [Trichonephila inaurata madagascariensis]|uniref:Aminopeptidase O n=1 Tax=Trichonephila inaurata madagascariensis TaxID=2747483 RepID=A0A8X7C282_9ARAC|nr:aminopeptidase O [Trichonephila inaurata madagascariensis]
MTECSLDEDLPLMSNVDDILVCHYNFNLKCDFKKKTFTCFALLFLKPISSSDKMDCCTAEQHFNSAGKDSSDLGFVLILDCHKILVKEVTELKISDDQFQSMMFSPLPLVEEEQLSFEVTDWSLKIWKNTHTCKFCFPKVIRILYETMPSCRSVLWVKDQNKNPTVFTYGAFINNRALFPCQEPPVAMATWEAVVTVTDSNVVLMSGDEEPQISCDGKYVHFYYYTKKVLPLSTLCLAIGTWEEYLIPLENKNDPKCRILACSNLLDKAIQEFSEYIPCCLSASQKFLGPYPFSRIDFLIVPPSFSSLGMASPNLVFLSQSLLSGDRSLCCRVSHEVTHGWFGLSIGALDWTEEWLSEGFATFMEDILHSTAIQMTCNDSKNYMELKALIRKKILVDEIENTQENLQILRASHGENSKHMVDGVNATVLKNGQNPMKAFIQVHYIKGYFLLKYLSELVDLNNFLNFLKVYVSKYEGQLVTSKEFISFFLNSFPSVRTSLSVENIYENWLHNSGITSEISNFKPSPENQLYLEVLNETEKWKKLNSAFLKKGPKRKKPCLDHFSVLTSDQTILLLENLLGVKQLHTCTLRALDEVFPFNICNAEVLHRWLELVLKHNYECQFNALKDFLIHHMAMGVYLYGELIYSEDKKLKEIARECYSNVKDEMEPNFQHTLEQMFLESKED